VGKLEIVFKEIKYSYFEQCNEEYPYKEDMYESALVCKKQIKEWLLSFLLQMQKIGYSSILMSPNAKTTTILDIVNDENFLFYSYEQGTEQVGYFITKDNKAYHSIDDWLSTNNDNLLLLNDWDGIGITVAGNKDIFRKIDRLNIPLWNQITDEHFPSSLN